jgi:hypothetical protein
MQPPSRLLESSDQAGVEKKSEPKNRRVGRASDGVRSVRMGVLGHGISILYPGYGITLRCVHVFHTFKYHTL